MAEPVGAEPAAAAEPAPSRSARACRAAEPAAAEPAVAAAPQPQPSRRLPSRRSRRRQRPHVRLAGRRADRRRARGRPELVAGTGTGGRVTKKDILAFIEAGPTRGRARAGRRRRAAGPPTRRRSQPAAPRAGRRPAGRAPKPAAPRAARAAAPGGRGRGADDGDAPRRDGAHAPLARHLGPRLERDRGRHVADRRRARPAEEGVPGLVRRQPDLPRVHRPRDRGDAEGLPVGERRDPGREDRHARRGSTSGSPSRSRTARG